MDRWHWLERVAMELAGQGLPARVRARLLEELRDHLDDLTEGNSDMATETEFAQRMGDPRELAATAAAQSRQAGWVQRHPLLVFGMSPVPAILLGVALYVLVVVAVGSAATLVGYDLDAFPRAADTALVYGIGFVPFLALAAVFGRLAVRTRVSRWWLITAVAQVAILGGLATVQLNWSEVPGQSQLLVGFGFPLSGWRQAAQLLLPLAVGWFAVRAANRRATVMA